MRVEVRNLRKEFGRTIALAGVSFSFESGQIVGFVGPNGAGKTTTMRIMATVEEPTDGDVLLDGVSVCEYPEVARRRVGFVPDTLPGHPDITVREYLDFFARAHRIGRRERADVLAAVEEFTGLTGLRDKTLKALSKGMKQRVSLARALIHDPEVLILDEPAAGLDPRGRVELRELLLTLAQRGKAIFISSHILAELTEICTAVVIIERGRVVTQGPIQEVVRESSRHRTFAMRLLETPPHEEYQRLVRILAQMPRVERVQLQPQEVLFDVSGDGAVACEILARLVAEGFHVLEFRQTRADLEDVFLKVTQGEVS
jgi:ABC-2 type transport system ATP-binding protein